MTMEEVAQGGERNDSRMDHGSDPQMFLDEGDFEEVFEDMEKDFSTENDGALGKNKSKNEPIQEIPSIDLPDKKIPELTEEHEELNTTVRSKVKNPAIFLTSVDEDIAESGEVKKDDNIQSNHMQHSNGNSNHKHVKPKSHSQQPQNGEITYENLMEENNHLRKQLLEMNRLVDKHLQSRGIKVPQKTSKRIVTASEKEVKNMLKQLEIYKKENEELRRQVYEISGIDKVIQLDNLVKEKKKKIDQIMEENKGLKNQVREQSKALEKLSEGPDKAISMISTEYKALKASYSKLKEKNVELMADIDKQNEKYCKLQLKCEKLEETMKSTDLTVDIATQIKKFKLEAEDKDKEIEELKKKLDIESRSKTSSIRKLKMELKNMQNELKRLMEDQEEKVKTEEAEKKNSHRKSVSSSKLPSRERKKVDALRVSKPVQRGNSKIPIPKQLKKNNMEKVENNSPSENEISPGKPQESMESIEFFEEDFEKVESSVLEEPSVEENMFSDN